MTGVSRLMEDFCLLLYVFACILGLSISTLSELFFVPFDPCLTTALFAVLSPTLQLSELPVQLLLSVLPLNVLFYDTGKKQQLYPTHRFWNLILLNIDVSAAPFHHCLITDL